MSSGATSELGFYLWLTAAPRLEGRRKYGEEEKQKIKMHMHKKLFASVSCSCQSEMRLRQKCKEVCTLHTI